MEIHNRLVHELLDIGEALLSSGAEVNRVEDTLIRLGRAYGAQSVDIFVITSDIVLTILFQDGTELTQTRRISNALGTDFQKLEALNALSRDCCRSPLPPEELHARVQAVVSRTMPAAQADLSSMVAAYSRCFSAAAGQTACSLRPCPRWCAFCSGNSCPCSATPPFSTSSPPCWWAVSCI